MPEASNPPPPIAIRAPTIDPGVNDKDERADMQSLIDATFKVLGSEHFRPAVMEAAVFRSGLWLSPYGENVPAKEALAAYLGWDSRFTNVVSRVKWGDASKGSVTGPDAKTPTEAIIELDPSVLVRWRSSCERRKSCAINSLAHELTHTVPQAQGTYLALFTDRGRSWATRRERALVSYTFGSVAQCVYLQEKDALDGASLADCVQRWGTNTFNSDDCN